MRSRYACLCAFALSALLSPSFAQTEDRDALWKLARKPPPAGALQLTMSLVKLEYFVGEPVRLDVKVRNVSLEPCYLEWGGFYQMAPVFTRFTATVTGPNGKQVVGPFPDSLDDNGTCGVINLKPGEARQETLPLGHWIDLRTPGAYAISIQHRFAEYPSTAPFQPTGDLNVKIVMPSQEQAEAVVASLGEDPIGFSELRLPLYLPLLLERMKTGPFRQMCSYGIAGIPTLDATKALVSLLDDKDATVARDAGTFLTNRMPSSSRGGDLFQGRPKSEVWSSELGPEIRRRALQFVGSNDELTQATGGRLLESVGLPEDAPVLVAALDIAVRAASLGTNSGETGSSWFVADGLGRSIRQLKGSGYKVSASPVSAAEKALFLQEIAINPDYRPKGWEQTYNLLLMDPIVYIRRKALQEIPAAPSLAAVVVDRISAQVHDPDQNIRGFAFEAVSRLKLESLRKDVLQALATEKYEPIIYSANHAAEAIGARVDALRVWASRVDDPDVHWEAVANLCQVVETWHGGGTTTRPNPEQARRLKAAWSTFLGKHGAELAAIPHFKPSDPALSQDLFLPEWGVALQTVTYRKR